MLYCFVLPLPCVKGGREGRRHPALSTAVSPLPSIPLHTGTGTAVEADDNQIQRGRYQAQLHRHTAQERAGTKCSHSKRLNVGDTEEEPRSPAGWTEQASTTLVFF